MLPAWKDESKRNDESKRGDVAKETAASFLRCGNYNSCEADGGGRQGCGETCYNRWKGDEEERIDDVEDKTLKEVREEEGSSRGTGEANGERGE